MRVCRPPLPPVLRAGLILALVLSPALRADIRGNSTDARLDRLGTEVNMNQGAAVARLGDINGDGLQDLAIGIPNADVSGLVDAGAVDIRLGSVTGFNPNSSDQTLSGNQAGMRFGAAIAGVGDVNGDGYDDFVIAAPAFDAAVSNVGLVQLYLGAASFDSTPDASYTQTQVDGEWGTRLAAAGDVNGDGYADLLIGSPLVDSTTGLVDAGRVQLFLGGSSVDTVADASFEGDDDGSRLGAGLAGAGDVNADGFADVLIGVPGATLDQSNEGSVGLFLGAASFDTTVDLVLQRDQAGADFGASLAGAGDVNGDGYADFAIAAPRYDNGETDEGTVWVYQGGAAPDAVAELSLESNQVGAEFGSVLGGEDLNGDSYAELLVGTPLLDDGASADKGAVSVYFGSANGTLSTGNRSYRPATAGARGGGALTVLDVFGDGYADLIFGAPTQTNSSNGTVGHGYAYAVYGKALLETGVDQTLYGDQLSARLGATLASGDLNGDGYTDLAAGQPNHDSTIQDSGRVDVYLGGPGGLPAAPNSTLLGTEGGARLGSALSIGDLDGDGYGDLIVGEPLLDNGGTFEAGAATVYRGGAVFTLVQWTRLAGTQPLAGFGARLAYAGDVNADGFGDLLVSAALHDGALTDEGRVFLYAGGSDQLTLLGTADGGQTGALLGYSVAALGDVNGDGFADYGAGAYSFDGTLTADIGAVSIWHGGAQLTPVPALVLTGETCLGMGANLASAGDVDGDGDSDVLVACHTTTTAGAIQLYSGSAAGVIPSGAINVPALTQTGAQVGFAMAAGDVDGDSQVDLLIGAPRYDNVSTDAGIATLLTRNPATGQWSSALFVGAAAAGNEVGAAVALADVDGDGYADLIAGAPGLNNLAALNDTGGMLVLIPNRNGRAAFLQQFRGDGLGNGRVELGGSAGARDRYTLKMAVSSSRGRERARLESQTCPVGAPWSNASPCVRTVATAWTDLGSDGRAELASTVSGLTEGRVYRSRVRAVYAPESSTQAGVVSSPNPAQRGPWRRIRAQSEVQDVRITDALFRNGFE